MGTAWSYDSDPNLEHDAVRESVGMFDMSPLKKIFVKGADAVSVLNHLVTRDVERIDVGKAAYLSVLTDEGTMADDAILYNLGDDQWMIVHGSGDTMALLEASAMDRAVTISFSDDLHDLSVQGPHSLQVLNIHCDIDLMSLGYFDHRSARLFGHPCRISRTSYSGEREYEIFADEIAVGELWDRLSEAGVMPCSFTALDKLRIEAGLLFYGYDMTTEHTPFEVGLGFTVSADKSGYRGHEGLMNAQGRDKINNICLDIDHTDMLNGGEELLMNAQVVGVVNSPCFSHRMNKSLALAM